MIHIGKNTRSTIVSKGISAGVSDNSYRGLVSVLKGADGARNFSQCDSLVDRRQMRRAHVSLYSGAQPDRENRARSFDFQSRRRPDFLLQSARHLKRRRGFDDRQRLLQRSLPRIADGVCGRSAKAAGNQSGRQRRLNRVLEDIVGAGFPRPKLARRCNNGRGNPAPYGYRTTK